MFGLNGYSSAGRRWDTALEGKFGMVCFFRSFAGMPSVRAAVGPQVKRVLLPAAATRLTSWTLIFMAVLMCGVCFAEEDGIDVTIPP